MNARSSHVRPSAATPDLNDGPGSDVYAGFDRNLIGRFSAYVAPHRGVLLAALAATVAVVASQVGIPMVIRLFVNALSHKAAYVPFVALFLGLVSLNAVAGFLQEWLAARVAQKAIFDLRADMFRHLQDVSMRFIDQTHVGSLMSRLQGDINALQEFLETSVTALGDLVLLLGIIVVLLCMDWQLGLLTLALLPVMIGLRLIWLPRVKSVFRRARDASSIVNRALAENINGMRVVLANTREAHNSADFERKAAANRDAQLASARAAQIMVPVVDILTGLAQASIVVFGGFAVARHRLDVGVLVAFIFYVQRFFDPIRTLSQQYTTMQRAMAAGHRIFEVIDVPLDIHESADAVDLPEKQGQAIHFRHVTFGYDLARPVLHDVSFEIKPKQIVALVGPTGSGKTSIVALLRRFYEPQSGDIQIDGHDVRDLTLRSLGRSIAMVLQDPFLFTGSVFDNIRYASGASRETVVAAAKTVELHDAIMALPLGYDTQLQQRGQNFSQGQRQLLSLARALVANPGILVLDEATASIDSFTERKIQHALKAVMAGRTCIVIAHRLTTIRDADKIIVLRQGRIAEQGSHNELVQREGLYATLNRAQGAAHSAFMNS